MLKFFSKLFLVFSFLSLVAFNFSPLSAHAAKIDDYQLSNLAGSANYNTASSSSSIESLGQKLLKIALAIMGILFLAFALYAGMRWMTAQGNEDHVTEAKETLEAAIIGLVVVASSYAITTLIFSKIGGTSPSDDSSTSTANFQEAGAECKTNDDCEGVCSLAKKCDVPCESDGDCVGNSNGPICNGEMQCSKFSDVPSGSGGPCADNSNCNDGLFCISNVCKANAGVGDFCLSGKCGPGLVCDEKDKCVNASSAATNEGDSCASASCASGLKCDDSKNICLKIVGEGENCLQSPAGFPVFCSGGLFCGEGAVCASQASNPEAKCLADGGMWNAKFGNCTSAKKIDQCISQKVECESSCSNTKNECESQCALTTSQCNVNNCDKPYDTCMQVCTPAACKAKNNNCLNADGTKKIMPSGVSCETECNINYPSYCSADCANTKKTCQDNCNTQKTCENSCTSDFNFCASKTSCEKNYQVCLTTP